MTWILRIPAVLVLWALVLVCLAAAAATTAVRLDVGIDLSALTAEQIADVQQASWIEVGLWAGAGLFFLVASIRLLRRTQGFWAWLIGFGLYGGRWAMGQQDSGGLPAVTQGLTVESFQPQTLAAAPDAPAAQVSVLAIVLVVGLIIFIIDAADRSYWDKHGA
jgi:hypothetical protein